SSVRPATRQRNCCDSSNSPASNCSGRYQLPWSAAQDAIVRSCCCKAAHVHLCIGCCMPGCTRWNNCPAAGRYAGRWISTQSICSSPSFQPSLRPARLTSPALPLWLATWPYPYNVRFSSKAFGPTEQTMKDSIRHLIQQALDRLTADGVLPAGLTPAIQVENTRDKSHGDFASNIAMMLAKPAGMKPRDLAQKLIDALPQDAQVSKV